MNGSQAEPPAANAVALESRLRQMADEDEYWDNDDLAAVHRAIAATLAAQRAQIAELLEALRQAVRSLEWWEKNEPASFGNIERSRLEDAHAAIAKATCAA